MRFQSVLLLLLGTAIANPLAQLQERQAPAPSVCAAQVGRCQARPTLQARASTWCASLGFGTSVRTARATSTARRTIQRTTTVFTSTTTSVAPIRTSTITSARTTTITARATRRVTSTTTTITVMRTGTFDSCPQYTLNPIEPGVPDPEPETTTEAQPEATTTAAEEQTTTTEAQAQTTTTTEAPVQGAGNQKRQAGRPSVKPGCLTANNAAETTNACRCIIPVSTTTRTTTVRATVTATRTIMNTRRAISTVTSRPVTTITTGELRTRTVTSTITSINRVAATITTTVAWELAATPTAFVLLDRAQGADAAIAQWGSGDPDSETFNDISYNTTRDTPSVFGFNEWNELHVAHWGEEDVHPVVGLETADESVRMAALAQADGSPTAKCFIQPTEDGQCPVKCTVGEYTFNGLFGPSRQWTLSSDGSDDFVNYAYSAEDGWEAAAAAAAAAAAQTA